MNGFVGAFVIGGTEIINASLQFPCFPEVLDDFVYIRDSAYVVHGIA